jgi:methyl-accepting chemotaxis protein
MSNSAALNDRLAFIELDGAAGQRLAGMKDALMAALPGALDRFYSKIQAGHRGVPALGKPDMIDSAKRYHQALWDVISDGRFDDAYLAAARELAEVHGRIGLDPRGCIAGHAALMEQLTAAILAARSPKQGFWRKRADPADVGADLGALIKAVFLDIDLALSVHLDAAEAARRASEERARVSAAAIGALRPALSALAGGDLTHRIAEPMPEDCIVLRQDFNAAMERLEDAVTGVAQTTQSVTDGARDLVRAADDLSRRTARQTAGLRRGVTALGTIAGRVRHTAESAAGTREVVALARTGAETASAGLREASGALGLIATSSCEIASMIALIDEIAVRTNMLALNAGIEAARAGDAGHGFAAVAAEVRVLAQRSAVAAREMKALTVGAGHRIEHGARLLGNASDALAAILGQLARVGASVDDIASVARDQAAGLDRVHAVVGEMEQTRGQTVAMVEASTAASHSLADDAGALARLAGRFRVSGPDRAASAIRPAPEMRPIEGGGNSAMGRRSTAPLRSIPGGLLDPPKDGPFGR